MTACTDDERREVARRLRGLNGNVSHVRRVYEDEGSSILCNDQADYYQICHAVAGYIPAEHMHPCDYDELHLRLADLIDPGLTEVNGGVDGVNEANGAEVDRDALLALADDLDYAGANVENVAYIDQTFHESARRIREALGVNDG